MRKGTGMRRLAAIALAAVMAAAAPHALAKTSEEDILLWLDGLDIGGPLPEASAVTAARGEGGEVAPGAADDEGDISDPAAQNYLGEQYCFGKGSGSGRPPRRGTQGRSSIWDISLSLRGRTTLRPLNGSGNPRIRATPGRWSPLP